MTTRRDRTLHGLDRPSGRMTLSPHMPPTPAVKPSPRFTVEPDGDAGDQQSDIMLTEPARGQTRERLGDVIGTLEQPAPTSDTHARRSATAPRRPPLPAALDRPARLADLSATVCHIRGLEQIHADDTVLQDRLRRSAADLEAIISHLLRTDTCGSSFPPPAPTSSASTPRQRALEHAFLGWLRQPTSTEELPLANGDGPEPLARILGELSLSNRPLPAQTAAKLGLPDSTTFGHAAVEVLLAVKDPAGPRCRSFRAAVFYLRDLDRDHFVEPNDEEDWR